MGPQLLDIAADLSCPTSYNIQQKYFFSSDPVIKYQLVECISFISIIELSSFVLNFKLTAFFMNN